MSQIFLEEISQGFQKLKIDYLASQKVTRDPEEAKAEQSKLFTEIAKLEQDYELGLKTKM